MLENGEIITRDTRYCLTYTILVHAWSSAHSLLSALAKSSLVAALKRLTKRTLGFSLLHPK